MSKLSLKTIMQRMSTLRTHFGQETTQENSIYFFLYHSFPYFLYFFLIFIQTANLTKAWSGTVIYSIGAAKMILLSSSIDIGFDLNFIYTSFAIWMDPTARLDYLQPYCTSPGQDNLYLLYSHAGVIILFFPSATSHNQNGDHLSPQKVMPTISLILYHHVLSYLSLFIVKGHYAEAMSKCSSLGRRE